MKFLKNHNEYKNHNNKSQKIKHITITQILEIITTCNNQEIKKTIITEDKEITTTQITQHIHNNITKIITIQTIKQKTKNICKSHKTTKKQPHE